MRWRGHLVRANRPLINPLTHLHTGPTGLVSQLMKLVRTNPTPRDPRVSFDLVDVAFDRPHTSVTHASGVSLTSGLHWSGLTWPATVDLITSLLCDANAVKPFLDFK